MKKDAGVELVTLSDSPNSPLPVQKPKKNYANQGTQKVVCLDSDTESDGTYAHIPSKGLYFNSSVAGEAHTKESNSWLGLHKCSSDIKAWSPNFSVSFEKTAGKDICTGPKTVIQSENLFVSLESSPSNVPKCDDNGDPHSLQIVLLSDHGIEPYADCKPLYDRDIVLGSDYSPCASLDMGIYAGNSYSYDMPISPCGEVKNALMPLSITKDINAPITHGACQSSVSQESDKYLSSPAWDDHLKGIIRKLEISKSIIGVDAIKKQDLEEGCKTEYGDEDSADSGRYSFLKKRPRKRDKSSDSEESSGYKRQQKSPTGMLSGADFRSRARTAGGSKKMGSVDTSRTTLRNVDDSLEKEMKQLKKKEKQMKNKEEREAKKQQLMEERETLRREKQGEKKRLQELRKRRNEEEKRRKEELKAEAVKRRKFEKEKEKWEKGKFALQNITALVDTHILEGGLIGGHLLTRFAEKSFKYHIVKNPVKQTVIWQMKKPSNECLPDSQEDFPSQDSQDLKASQISGPQLSLDNIMVSYVLVVLEAEDFLSMIMKSTLDKHIRELQRQYPGFTLCYLINKLMRYLHKREQQQYKNPGDTWTRPPVEQVLAKLVTSYEGVHSRLCVDEAEVSEHIVGLTRSLAECPFKRKLTPLSLSANGDHVVKNDPNNDLIKKNLWLKALVALPKVSGACAIAIAKKYPTMSALFEAYLDPDKTVHEKEYLLQDLMKEGLLGGESNRRVGPTCSKHVYLILTAQQGNLHTDDVEEGADAFRN